MEVSSFIGQEISDPTSPLAEIAPRGAKHVVTLSWFWSPAHSRRSEYQIASDRKRQSWDLYELKIDDDTGDELCSRVASGAPRSGVNAQHAASRLLEAAWQDEFNHWEFEPEGFIVDASGLLDEGDIHRVVDDLKWRNRSSWLQVQSTESLNKLRALFERKLDNQEIETLDEIDACAKELQLSSDYLKLCQHYEISPTNIISLIYFVARDTAVHRERATQKALKNVAKLLKEIDILVSELDPNVLRCAVGRYPSIQSAVHGWLSNYVGKHGELPKGRHPIHGAFNSVRAVIDFDELRRKYGL